MTEKDLHHELADSLGVGDSKVVPAIIKAMADDKAIQVVHAASPPATVEELSEKTGIAASEVETILDDMFLKGLIYKSKKPEGTRYYKVRRLLQFHDANIVTPGISKDILNLWRDFDRNEYPDFFKKMEDMLPSPPTRVIPVGQSVAQEAQVAPFDDIKKMVDEAYRLAVVPCTCRLVEGECGLPLDNCIQVNKAADYTMERGTGRELTKEETYKILEEARDAGLVHVVDNRRSLGHIICNCCSDCCINWPDPLNYRQKFTAPSRYSAYSDPETCTSCEDCIDRCHFGAITMEAEGETALVSEAKCMGCGVCISTCPSESLSLIEKRELAFVPE